ncbi:MAG: hypothetical protein ACO1OQ_16315 [Rufibacter sp.]
MGLRAIKTELIEWLAQLEDEETIEYLKVLKDSFSDRDWWNNLTPEQKASIERGKKDIDEGRMSSHLL